MAKYKKETTNRSTPSLKFKNKPIKAYAMVFYGPKFVENIVQATARDLLCYAMNTLKELNIVMHIHDEVVIEADSSLSLDRLCELISDVPSWHESCFCIIIPRTRASTL